MTGLESLGLDEGAHVAVSSFTWVACADAVFRAGLVPVLVDVDKTPVASGRAPCALDVHEDVEAVLAVHMSCVMADVPALVRAAESVGAVVVEGLSQAHGARWLGRSALEELRADSRHHPTAPIGGGKTELVDLLEPLLADVEGARLLRPRPAQTRTSIYEASFIFDPLPSGMTNKRLAEAWLTWHVLYERSWRSIEDDVRSRCQIPRDHDRAELGLLNR